MNLYNIDSNNGRTLEEEIPFDKKLSEGKVQITGFEVKLQLGKKERFSDIKQQFEKCFPQSEFTKIDTRTFRIKHEFHIPIPVSSEEDIMHVEERIKLAMPCALPFISPPDGYILLNTNQYWKSLFPPETIDLVRCWPGFEFGELESPTFKAKITMYDLSQLSDLPDELRSEALKRIESKLLAFHPKPIRYSIQKDHVWVEWPYPFHYHGFSIYDQFAEHKRKWSTDPLDCGPDSFWETEELDSDECFPSLMECMQTQRTEDDHGNGY